MFLRHFALIRQLLLKNLVSADYPIQIRHNLLTFLFSPVPFPGDGSVLFTRRVIAGTAPDPQVPAVSGTSSYLILNLSGISPFHLLPCLLLQTASHKKDSLLPYASQCRESHQERGKQGTGSMMFPECRRGREVRCRDMPEKFPDTSGKQIRSRNSAGP